MLLSWRWQEVAAWWHCPRAPIPPENWREEAGEEKNPTAYPPAFQGKTLLPSACQAYHKDSPQRAWGQAPLHLGLLKALLRWERRPTEPRAPATSLGPVVFSAGLFSCCTTRWAKATLVRGLPLLQGGTAGGCLIPAGRGTAIWGTGDAGREQGKVAGSFWFHPEPPCHSALAEELSWPKVTTSGTQTPLGGDMCQWNCLNKMTSQTGGKGKSRAPIINPRPGLATYCLSEGAPWCSSAPGTEETKSAWVPAGTPGGTQDMREETSSK